MKKRRHKDKQEIKEDKNKRKKGDRRLTGKKKGD